MPNSKTAAAAAKTWSAADEARLSAVYAEQGKPNDTEALKAIGSEFGNKTVNQIRGKLVSMGIYEKGEAKSVGNASGTRKIEIVNAIEILLSKNKGSFASLEKANKIELESLCNALTALSDKHDSE